MKNTLRSALYEYYEMIENTLHKSCTQKRQICYLEVPSPDVNAFAAPFKNQSNIFVIGVHDGLLYSLYNGIMVEKRLAKIITRIKNEYSVIEKDEDIYRMVYITSALICFYHEFGHIFNGHLLEYNKNNSNLILQERSAHEAPTGIPINGYQDGNRWSTPWTWCYAPVSRRQYGKPCNPPDSCFDFCTSFWYRICLACRTGWLVCQFCDFLCGT